VSNFERNPHGNPIWYTPPRSAGSRSPRCASGSWSPPTAALSTFANTGPWTTRPWGASEGEVNKHVWENLPVRQETREMKYPRRGRRAQMAVLHREVRRLVRVGGHCTGCHSSCRRYAGRPPGISRCSASPETGCRRGVAGIEAVVTGPVASRWYVRKTGGPTGARRGPERRSCEHLVARIRAVPRRTRS